MNRLHKLLTLTPDQCALLIAAMILLPLTKLSLTVSGFKKTYNRISNSPVNTAPEIGLDSTQWHEARTIARMINIAAAHGPYRANCLTRSALLMFALKRRCIPCQLMIGANKPDNFAGSEFGVHAWVESAGKVLNDSDDIATHYKIFQLPTGRLR